MDGVAADGRVCVCCCLSRCTMSGRGGTTGLALGWPASGRAPAGRGAIGAPGVNPDVGRCGAGRAGMGAPGTLLAAGAPGVTGPGATMWVGGCGVRDATGGATGMRGGSAVRARRSGAGMRAGSGGSGCRGPAGAAAPGALGPVRADGGRGRAGIAMFRFPAPPGASGACRALPPPNGGRSGRKAGRGDSVELCAVSAAGGAGAALPSPGRATLAVEAGSVGAAGVSVLGTDSATDGRSGA